MFVRNCLSTIGFLCFAFNLPAQVAVSVDGMNVLYPVLENPITVVSFDVPDSNLLLVPSMGEIQRTGLGHYNWRICHRDTNFATLAVRDLRGDSVVIISTFRVNRVPEPTPRFGGRKRRNNFIPNGEYLQNSGGISVGFEYFDFDLRCDVVHFDLLYIPKGQDGVIKKNIGTRWNSEVQEQINKAKPGDEYHFYHIAYRCGCDPMVRYLSEELNFSIK